MSKRARRSSTTDSTSLPSLDDDLVVTPGDSPPVVPTPRECGNCRHWKPIDVELQGRRLGCCTRFPPNHLGLDLTPYGPVTNFGVTLSNTSCGEHSPTPTA